MGQNIIVTGMVLNAMPIGDYDKRITLLTRERGKITAFARGARRPNSQLLAATSPFSFGEFEVFEGRSAYTVSKAAISNYFWELVMDFDITYYGFYFLEFADYFCQENMDEKEMLKLLYQSLRALESAVFDNRLVRIIFELKALALNGVGPNVFTCLKCGKREGLGWFSFQRGGTLCEECGITDSKENKNLRREVPWHPEESSIYTIQYIISSKVEKLYTFTVSEKVLRELEALMKKYLDTYLDHSFKSLKILNEAEKLSGTDFTG